MSGSLALAFFGLSRLLKSFVRSKIAWARFGVSSGSTVVCLGVSAECSEIGSSGASSSGLVTGCLLRVDGAIMLVQV